MVLATLVHLEILEAVAHKTKTNVQYLEVLLLKK